jgi:proteasome-associated ATPase
MTAKSSEVLEEAKEIITKQQDYLRGIFSQAFTYAVVVNMGTRITMPEKSSDSDYLPSEKHVEGTCVIIHQNQHIEVVYSEMQKKLLKLTIGDTVKCVSTKSGIGITEKAEPQSYGLTVSIKDIPDKDHAEIDANGTVRMVLTGLFADPKYKLEKGCRVILDETGTIIMKNLGKMQGQYVFSANTGVSWDDIGGLEDVKQEMAEAIENPIKYAELYSAYGRKPTKGILLWGPPGNGKTMIGKAVATSIAKLYNTTESGFIYIKGPEILNMYVGASEERIRSIFASAREFKKKTNCPAIIFIDEAEAILSKRGTGKSSDVDKTIVPQFLTEMDGLDESSAIVILTTNRPDMLDSAIIREGRIDKKIKVPRPTQQSVEMIFNLNLRKVPCVIDSKKIAKSAAQLVFDKELCLYDISLKSGNKMQFCMLHIINGAMIAAIVNEAITSAINRDLLGNKKVPTGVTLEDLHDSIMKSFRQNSRMNHEQHFADLAYELTTEKNDEISEIKPVLIKDVKIVDNDAIKPIEKKVETIKSAAKEKATA